MHLHGQRSPHRRLRLAVAVAASAAVASAAHGADWVEVLATDDQGMEIVLRAPALQQSDGAVFVPGFAWGGEPGLPIEFERAAFVAVPTPGGALLEILATEEERLSGVAAPRQPLPPARDADALPVPRAAPVPPATAWTGTRPAAAVSLEPGGVLRGRDVVLLRFTPLLFGPGGGATFVHTVHLRLRFAARPRLRSRADVPEPLHAGCLNAVTAARWETRFTQQKAAAPAESAALPATRLRLRLAATGLYRVDYDRLLEALGTAVNEIDPTTLKLYVDTWAPVPLRADSTPSSWQTDYALREVALWVQGEENRFLDPGDFIAFYAVGPKEYVDVTGQTADSLLHAQYPYERYRYAWLVWGGRPGRRMPTAASPLYKAPLAERASTTLVQRTWTRVHYEEDRLFGAVDDLWYWEELRRNNPAFVSFDADLGGDTTADGWLRLAIGASDYYGNGNHAVDVTLNSQALGQVRWIQPVSRPQNHYVTLPVTLGATNRLQLALGSTGSATADRTLFLKFDLVWERPLALPTRGPETGRLSWSRRPVTPDEVYELRGFGAQEPWVLDVTEPETPVRLTNGTAAAGTWSYRYGRGNGVLVHYQAVPAPLALGRADVTLRNMPALRAPQSVPDMLIVTHASLREQAERLARHRAAHFPGAATLGHVPEVRVVDVADIYDEFSGGRVDPLAIRNYVKLLYTQPLAPGDTAPRLRYVLLFGEATHDPRRLLPGSTPTLVPTVHTWYADPVDAGSPVLVQSRHLRREYAVEDWFGEMDAPRNAGVSSMHPLPDLGVGRLTARSLGEAQRLVDKLVDYDLSTDYGAWRTRVILSADDECKTGNCVETEHVGGMERLVPLTPPEWDVTKIYLTEYPGTLGQKPQGRAAFIDAWSAGAALVTYQGHGAPRQLADEVLFLSTDIPKLTNGRRLPVFMAYSCTVAEFDAPELQTMCEDLVASTAGGAVAAVGATVFTFASPNIDYNIVVWQTMFEPGATTKVPFGIAHQVSKSRSPQFSGQNNEKYVLIGDPAMTFLSPEALVRLTGADSLEAGRSRRVEGIVHAPGAPTPLAGFNGFADVEVLGTADESGYKSAVSPFVRIPYDLPGPPLYRGKVAVQNGRLDFQFVVPLGARLGNKARLSAYAYDAQSDMDAKGAANGVRVVRAAQPDSSLGPPRIALFFPNNLTRVKPGTPLVGEIRDENGINIQGTTLPSSILLDFDAQNQPLNVTSQFRYVDGSDSVGTVSVPLPEGLSPGPHTATLIASDNLQNRSTQSLGFEVIPLSATLMANVIAFPNPFKERTYFIFELTDPADVTVRVFTASGREVWRVEQFVAQAQQVSIRWDGVDFARDELANGTYLYRVEARPRSDSPAKGPVLKQVGKVVVMRD